MKSGKLKTLFDYDGQEIVTLSVPPPSIMPVVILKGSDYQMGFQYGQQAGPYIESLKEASWVSLLETQSREEVLNSLKRFQVYINQYTPEALAQVKGMADGATANGYEVSFHDVLVINCLPKKLAPTVTPSLGVGSHGTAPEEGCSVFAAWGDTTTDRRLIFGDSKDSVFNHQVTIVAFPDNGHNYITGVRAGELSEHFAMSSKGLFMGTGVNPAKRDIDLGYGLYKPFFLQHMLRFANSASEAKDMFLSWEFPNATNFTFADIQGNAFVVERTAAAKPVRRPGDFGETDFIYSTNNAMTDEMKEAVEGKVYIDHAGWVVEGSAIPRALEVWNMLHNYPGKIDLDFIKMMWRFNDHPDPYSLSPAEFSVERDQKICHHENMRVAVGCPDNGNKGMVYICTGPVGRKLHPPTPRHRDCFQVAGTHTFYKLHLASNPIELVRAARQQAHDDLALASYELRKLRFSDNGYAVLHAISTRATAEYYDGVYAYQKGYLGTANKALLYFAQAATAFTRSQAHARQITEALVPPATSPSELGLRPYGECWGKWATR